MLSGIFANVVQFVAGRQRSTVCCWRTNREVQFVAGGQTDVQFVAGGQTEKYSLFVEDRRVQFVAGGQTEMYSLLPEDQQKSTVCCWRTNREVQFVAGRPTEKYSVLLEDRQMYSLKKGND